MTTNTTSGSSTTSEGAQGGTQPAQQGDGQAGAEQSVAETPGPTQAADDDPIEVA